MPLKKGTETELIIEATAFEGKGIAKVDGLAMFVPNTTPGDHVKIRITKSKKKYREGKLVELLEPGPRRIEPKCRHARECGGCSWQHVDYDYQLRFKREQVQEHMKRIGGLKDIEVNNTIRCDNPFYYRNKMEYSIGARRWLSTEEINREVYVDDHCFAAGLHAPGRYDKILNLQECHLQDPVSYQILDFVRSWCIAHEVEPFNIKRREGFMRNVVIRTSEYTGDLMVNLVSYEDDPDIIEPMSAALLEAFPDITTIINNINDRSNPTAVGRYEKIIHGPGYIVDCIGGYEFEIDANSFFQTNTQQAERLYAVARRYAEVETGDTIFDLYCGVGTLSLFLSKKAERVLGIELSKVAIRNANKNAQMNEVKNVEFLQGDILELMGEDITEKYGRPDCLITDPPRAGMHPDVVDQLNKLKVPKLVYISCNSSTMARDLKKLSEVYHVGEIQPVDMFPQTYHIETVAKLRLRDVN